MGTLEGQQRLPFVFFKSNATGRLWAGAREFLDVLDSPGHHQIDGQAIFPNCAISELTVLNAATTLERAMILLDAPALVVPIDLIESLLEAVDLERGQQHPLDGFFGRRWIDLGDVDGPKTQRTQRGIALGGMQLHPSKVYLQHTSAGRSPFASWKMEHTLARHRLAFHVRPKTRAAIFDSSVLLSSNQKLRVSRIAFGQQKQLVDIGLAIPDTDHRCGGSKLALQARRALKTLEPFVALFLFNRSLVTGGTFTELLRIARPGLDVDPTWTSR